MPQQVALLRVLETKCVTRVGGSKEIPIDIRIVCATNRNLKKEVEESRFRSDLYYRLNIINIKIPPLRHRREDIFLLLGYFIKRFGSDSFSKKTAFSDEQLIRLYNYDWPGNVRELQNVVERMRFRPEETVDEIIHTCEWGGWSPKIEAEIRERSSGEKKSPPFGEEDELKEALVFCEGNISMVARKLQVSRKTVYKRMKKYGIGRDKEL